MELRIGDIDYGVDFKGFHEVLKFSIIDTFYEFQPFPLKEYFKSMTASIRQIGDDIALDKDLFAKSILFYNGIDEEHIRELTPIALWWGCGGIEKIDLSHANDNWYNFGSVQIQLLPLSYEIREKIFNKYIKKQSRSYLLDYAGLLQAIVSCSAQALRPEEKFMETLDSYWSRGLIEKVIETNFNNRNFYNKLQTFIENGSYGFVENTLSICKALGWTPEKVFDTPAKEIDAILVLLEMADKKKMYTDNHENRKPVPRSQVLNHPDAVIIEIEDD